MPMSVNFNWRPAQVQVPAYTTEQDDVANGMKSIGNAIKEGRQWRWKKAEQERRNKIEDEDRARRIAEEDRKKRVYGEAADMMRGELISLDKLMQRRQEIVSEMEKIKAQLGG